MNGHVHRNPHRKHPLGRSAGRPASGRPHAGIPAHPAPFAHGTPRVTTTTASRAVVPVPDGSGRPVLQSWLVSPPDITARGDRAPTRQARVDRMVDQENSLA